MCGKNFRLGSTKDGAYLDFDLFARGQLIKLYGLKRDGHGVANPATASQYAFDSLLAYPLKSGDRFMGYLNHFSSQRVAFTSTERNLLEIFARQAVITIERFDPEGLLDWSFGLLSELSKSLQSMSPSAFLTHLAEMARQLLSVRACIVWTLHRQTDRFRIAGATSNVDDAYRRIELDRSAFGVNHHLEHRDARTVGYLHDVSEQGVHYTHAAEAKQRGWVTLLTAPMWVDTEFIGMIDVYTDTLRHFKPWEKRVFGMFANRAALSIGIANLLAAVSDTNKRRTQLNEALDEISEARNAETVMQLILHRALQIVNSRQGYISRFDQGGELRIVHHVGNPPKSYPLRIGQGVSGKALSHEQPIIVSDSRSADIERAREEMAEYSGSILAVPMLIANAQIRTGGNIRHVSRPVGVLTVCKPGVGEISSADCDILLPLANQAAMLIERLESERQLNHLRQIERDIFGKRDAVEIINTLLRGIVDAFGFQYVNISLVIPGERRVKSTYVIGIPNNREGDFVKRCDYSFESQHIHASIIRARTIEVLDIGDERYDPALSELFTHERWLRVFIPMIIPPQRRPLGILEAGYPESYRRHIYERDVQNLKNFVDYAVFAHEQSKSLLLDPSIHGLRNPIVSIRGTASRLMRRHPRRKDNWDDRKMLASILHASDLLRVQIRRLEYILEQETGRVQPERVDVFKDVITPVKNLLRPVVEDRGLNWRAIRCKPNASTKPLLYLDKGKLTEIVYNLMANAILYAHEDSSLFNIQVLADEDLKNFYIRFQDSGIGINPNNKNRIFDRGFRSDEAVGKNVAGSGHGLTIARDFARSLGGELELLHYYRPTEFVLSLPKSLGEKPHDTIRR
jgi:signal transduction histidine kinase/GAF domain-containing protein